MSRAVQAGGSHIRARAGEGIASLCLVLDSFIPLPTGALKNGEILQFSTATTHLFLENKTNASPAFCKAAFLLPLPWQQVCNHCQSEAVGAVWESSLTAFCWAVSLDMRGAICLPSREPPSAVLAALVRPFAVRGAGGARPVQGSVLALVLGLGWMCWRCCCPAQGLTVPLAGQGCAQRFRSMGNSSASA